MNITHILLLAGAIALIYFFIKYLGKIMTIVLFVALAGLAYLFFTDQLSLAEVQNFFTSLIN